MSKNRFDIMVNIFDDELNEKFRTLPNGKIQADFGTNVSFVKTENNRPVDEFKNRFPTEYKMTLDDWFDIIHPY